MAAEIHGTSDPCHVTRVTSDEVFSRVRIVPLLIAVCLVGVAASAQTSTYVFVPEQSQVVQTGGIASVHWTYTIRGQFQLAVDPNAGSASFGRVDANATDDSPFKRTLDPDHVFNMTSLVGVVVGDTTIKFTGKAPDDSDVSITVTLQDNLAHLVGQTTPPPNSADFFIFSLDAVAQRKYGGGSGTAEDPYQIATADDLIALGETYEDYDKHFILTDDIDLDPNLPRRKVFERAVIAPDVNDVEWGFQGVRFTGGFDGNGHTISNLTVHGGSYLGLFGCVGGFLSLADIANVRMDNVDVNGIGDHVGSLVGNFGDWGEGGVMTNCYSTGTVSGSSEVGGLVGSNGYFFLARGGVLANCYTAATVTGYENVGGLVGYNSFGSVVASYGTGTVSGHSGVGGLIGTNDQDGTVIRCFATCTVVADESGGGLVGVNCGYSGQWGGSRPAVISDCYSIVMNDSRVSGLLVGQNSRQTHPMEPSLPGLITNCYGACDGLGKAEASGLVGLNWEGGETSNSFWDTEACGVADSTEGGSPKTTAEMQTANTFLEAGWDFVNVWGIGESQTYPYLRKYSAADINQDASVSFLDLALLAENWLAPK
jgi:hypothetical protein